MRLTVRQLKSECNGLIQCLQWPALFIFLHNIQLPDLDKGYQYWSIRSLSAYVLTDTSYYYFLLHFYATTLSVLVLPRTDKCRGTCFRCFKNFNSDIFRARSTTGNSKGTASLVCQKFHTNELWHVCTSPILLPDKQYHRIYINICIIKTDLNLHTSRHSEHENFCQGRSYHTHYKCVAPSCDKTWKN